MFAMRPPHRHTHTHTNSLSRAPSINFSCLHSYNPLRTNGYGSKLTTRPQVFSPWFHLPVLVWGYPIFDPRANDLCCHCVFPPAVVIEVRGGGGGGGQVWGSGGGGGLGMSLKLKILKLSPVGQVAFLGRKHSARWWRNACSRRARAVRVLCFAVVRSIRRLWVKTNGTMLG